MTHFGPKVSSSVLELQKNCTLKVHRVLLNGAKTHNCTNEWVLLCVIFKWMKIKTEI